ncbi:MAG: outer membrane protein transport protein [Gammaproteobacteria bacterium]|nr:outer membrane protein transport protein [Gammaproteobacteria bacterium]
MYGHLRPVLAALLCLLAAPVFATNGFFFHGYGGKSLGMGGGGVAFPQDSFAAVNNPAGSVWLGNRVDFDVQLFLPSNVEAGLGAHQTESEWDRFFTPNIGGIYHLSPDLAVGLAIYGNGGMGSKYPENIFNQQLATLSGSPELTTADTRGFGVNLASVLATPHVAWRFTPRQSVGASLLVAAQNISVRGFGNFHCFTPTGSQSANCALGLDSDTPSNNLTNQGYELTFGLGLRLGWYGQVTDELALGASYSSTVKMQRFKRYSELFPDGGTLDLPPKLQLGFAYEVLPRTIVTFDFQRVFYSRIKAFDNPGPVLVGGVPAIPAGYGLLGTENGLGFGWNNQNIYQIGISHDYDQHWTLRAGFNYGKNQVPPESYLLNFLSVPVAEQHLHLGFTYTYINSKEFTVAYTHGFGAYVNGPTPLGQAHLGQTTESIDVSYAWKF